MRADFRSRILSRYGLRIACERLRRAGQRIVTTNGVFDVLHEGHLFLLEHARRLGDVLIVGVNSDASVRRQKGKGLPIFPARLRARLLATLRLVDAVHVFPAGAPRAMLRVIRPDVHVNSAEYGARCVEADVVRRFGGRLVLLPRKRSLGSSTALHARLRKEHTG